MLMRKVRKTVDTSVSPTCSAPNKNQSLNNMAIKYSKQSLRERANNLLHESGYFSKFPVPPTIGGNKREKVRAVTKKQRQKRRMKQYMADDDINFKHLTSINKESYL